MYGDANCRQDDFFAGLLLRVVSRRLPTPENGDDRYSWMFCSADLFSTAQPLPLTLNPFRMPASSILITMPSVTQTISQASGTEMYLRHSRSNSRSEYSSPRTDSWQTKVAFRERGLAEILPAAMRFWIAVVETPRISAACPIEIGRLMGLSPDFRTKQNPLLGGGGLHSSGGDTTIPPVAGPA